MDDEGDGLDDVTEKELLLEIFRQVRAIRRLLVVVLVVLPLLWLVAVVVAEVLNA